MSDKTRQVEAMVDALAPLLGLTIDDDMKPHVISHLAIAARMVTLLEDFPLDDREEPAPVFTP